MEEFTLSEEQVEEFKSAFFTFSKDELGTISTKDLAHVMKSEGMRHITFNMPEQEVIEMLEEVNLNSEDGTISFQEFLELMEKKILNDQKIEEELLDAFRVFDRDSTGSVSADELKTLLQNMGEKLTEDELEMCIRDEDVGLNGRINYAEYVHNMMMIKE